MMKKKMKGSAVSKFHSALIRSFLKCAGFPHRYENRIKNMEDLFTYLFILAYSPPAVITSYIM